MELMCSTNSSSAVATLGGMIIQKSHEAELMYSYQFAGIFVALAFAVVGGTMTGFIAKFICRPPKRLFSDAEFWELPYDYDEKCLEHDHKTDDHSVVPASPTPASPATDIEMVPVVIKV